MTEIRRNRVRTRIDDAQSRTSHRAPAGPPDQALHVLSMAQRTADDHLQTVYLEADRIRAEAEEAAEQIARDAQARQQQIREQADQLIEDARKTADQRLREAQDRAEEMQRDARNVLAQARAQAERTDASARAEADELRQAARFRHDQVIGELDASREAYQRHIEQLAQFDHEYRARLTAFMQTQLRMLWTDQPHVDDEQLDDREAADQAAYNRMDRPARE
jgi:cell division septum initiation protein DivIVA